MAGPYKFTMLFNVSTGQGFSESWYYQSASTIGQLSLTDFDALATARDNLCASFVNLVGWRLSDTTDPRKTYVKTFTDVSQAGNIPDPASTAWLASARGADGVGRRQFWMRGILDSWVSFNLTTNQWNVVGGFKSKFDAFVSLLTSQGSNWRIQTITSRKQSATARGVATVAPSVSGNTTLLSLADVTPYGSTPIIVSGFKKPLSYLNGTYINGSGYDVNAGTNSIILLQRQVNANAASFFGKGGVVRTKQTTLTPITHVELVSPRSRRVGRAFFVPAGRR